MLANYLYLVNGSSLLLPAYGRAGQGQHSLATHFAKRNTKNCDGEKEVAKARAGKNSFPPTPFLFARPSGKVLIKIQNLDFRQKKFGFCPKGTA